MMLASALAYSSFFAIPSVLIVATGLFTLIAGPDTITSLDAALARRHPGAGDGAARRLAEARRRATRRRASLMTIVGFVLAVWSVTGAMNAYMLALNLAYERKDRRSFVQKRVVALKMAVVIGRRVRARRGADDLRAGGRACDRVAHRAGRRRAQRPLVGRAVADPARRPARRVRDAALSRPRRRACGSGSSSRRARSSPRCSGSRRPASSRSTRRRSRRTTRRGARSPR